MKQNRQIQNVNDTMKTDNDSPNVGPSDWHIYHFCRNVFYMSELDINYYYYFSPPSQRGKIFPFQCRWSCGWLVGWLAGWLAD